MSYVVNNHLDNLYVVSNKAVGPGKNAKLITVGPTSIPDSRVPYMRSVVDARINCCTVHGYFISPVLSLIVC